MLSSRSTALILFKVQNSVLSRNSELNKKVCRNLFFFFLHSPILIQMILKYFKDGKFEMHD